ncbi:MAG: metallophosphoesterase family protein [Myxococcota bacterium]
MPDRTTPDRTTTVGRVGVLGDVHAEDRHLELALAAFAEHRVDARLAVGDVLDGPGDADRCCDLLQQANVLTVLGNHDRWWLHGQMRSVPHATGPLSERSRAFIASLPATRALSTPMGTVLLCHGVGEDDMAALTPETRGYSLQAIPALRELMLSPDVSFIVGGHTHRRMVRRFQGLVAINAGTLLRDHEPGFVVIDFEAAAVQFFDILDGERIETAQAMDLPYPAPLHA